MHHKDIKCYQIIGKQFAQIYQFRLQILIMKKRLNLKFLKQLKQRTIHNKNPYERLLYSQSSNLISDMYHDVVNPFNSICVHSARPHSIVRSLVEKQRLKINDKMPNLSINIANQHNSAVTVEQLRQQFKQYNELAFGQQTCVESGRWIGEPQKYDLIFSDMQLHLSESSQTILKGYQNSLKSDGALIGCCFGQSTLRELYWSYMMAQNERSGGISPKIVSFPSMGLLGSILTGNHYTLCTVINKQYQLQFESIIDLLSVIQQLGQSGYLFGRRKGIYKDVLLAMAAMYHSQFAVKPKFDSNQKITSNNIIGTVQLLNFIGWKYSQSQPKPLRRGQRTTVGSKDFLDQLKDRDPDFKHWIVNDQDDEPKRVR